MREYKFFRFARYYYDLAGNFTRIADSARGEILLNYDERLLVSVGCKLIEGDGSRVRFEKDEHVATFHRPHLAKEAKRYQVRDARQFLENIGVRP